METFGYAAHSPDTPLAPYAFARRDLLHDDVAIDILYCGVCHSDLHMARNDWGTTHYPLVPGHEIVGRVSATGPAVTRHRPGDLVAIGCMVDSCGRCDQCETDREQYCRERFTDTYGAPDKHSDGITQGGYSTRIVCRERFVLGLPPGLDPAAAAPLLCAGITSYSPLKAWNVGKGTRLGVIGLGGLGHMAVKLGAAMDADVTVLTRSPAKEIDARDLGANRTLLSTDAQAMKAARGTFDLILDTVPVRHDLAPYLPLLDVDGTLVLVGQIGPMEEMSTVPLVFGRRRIAGSLIGGIAETQEMLDFCAKRNVVPDVEIIAMDRIEEAFARMKRSDVRYRFVIDMSTLNAA